MDAFTRYRNSVTRVPGWQDSYDRLNLSDISLSSSELSTRVRNDMAATAPSLLSTTRDLSPIQSPTSSPDDSIDTTSFNASRSPANSDDRGPETSLSRMSGRERFRAPPTQTSMAEADRQRTNALAKNRTAANRYRLRQKGRVESLERRCRKEIEQRHIKNSLVKSLQREILRLNEEIMRQSSLCNCLHVRGQLDIRDRLYAQLMR